MIIDQFVNANLYAAASPALEQAFDYLRRTDLTALPIGRIEIEGQALFALVQEYSPKPREEGRWEAHRRYIDLQYMVSGTELVGVAPLSRLTPGPYDPAWDHLPLTGQGDFLTLTAGEFILLHPGDAHMPGLSCDPAGPVRKVVLKIAVS